MKHYINTFLTTDTGRTITGLTKLVYYNIPSTLGLNVKRYSTKISHMDVDHFQFKEYDLFVFQGTSCVFDWIADLKMALGIRPRQFKAALKYVKNNMLDDKLTYVSGHSLGGAITQYVVHKLDKDNVIGVTYNGAGIKHLIREKKDNSYIIMNYHSDKDILNKLTSKLPWSYFKHIGSTRVVKDEYSKSGLQSHGNFFIFR